MCAFYLCIKKCAMKVCRVLLTEDRAREKETAEPPRKCTECTAKGLAEAFADHNKLLTKHENMDPTWKGFH